jgi:tripartite-type tricarboxylate transporter receptor subunit TctC
MAKLLKRRNAIASGTALFGIEMLGAPSIGRGADGGLPKGPIRLVVGYSPGGPADSSARLIAQRFTDRTGITMLVENKPGAGGVIATEAVSKAPADGNMLILANMASTILAKLTYPRLPYDPQNDLAPISLLSTFQYALSVIPSVPATNISQFAAWAKANPPKANFGVPAVGGIAHFFGLMLGKAIGVDMQPVPYKGTAPMLIDHNSGQLYVSITGLEVLPMHQAGKLRILATSGIERSQAAPEIPTFIESGFANLAGEGWFGLYAPAKTAPAVVAALSTEVETIMKQPDLRKALVVLGVDPRGSPPAGLAEFDENEFRRWQPVVAASGFKVE